jgi:uncharacterized protein (DUF608 family)
MRIWKFFATDKFKKIVLPVLISGLLATPQIQGQQRKYNGVYSDEYLNYVAFPLGGIGAGMICIEGTGAISHVSVRNNPDMFNEPRVFSAVCIKSKNGNTAKVLEGPVPKWKYFGGPGTGRGSVGKTYGLPRFANVNFLARFPFCIINLDDPKMPLEVEITAWSPFTPPEANDSSLPVACLEYRFTNTSSQAVEAIYSFNAANFMAVGESNDVIMKTQNGFILSQPADAGKPWQQGAFAALTDSNETKVNLAWFRGGWLDKLTTVWNDITDGNCIERPPVSEGGPAPGASLYVPFSLEPKQSKTIKILLCWYVPNTNLRLIDPFKHHPGYKIDAEGLPAHKPWYSGKFKNIAEVAAYWQDNFLRLRSLSKNFSDCLYDTTLPPELIEATTANLTILKSPTILRQTDGKLWCWEGSGDDEGLGPGSCTHVWNYAQATCHLFPELERTMRQTEFYDCQDANGHQAFRAPIPIQKAQHTFHAAADGQLGGILKVYRDWRISGDTAWLKEIWPRVKASLNYCIATWDPNHNGALFEPHHNTIDVEFWGPDIMCGSFYLGALSAAEKMSEVVGDPQPLYNQLLQKGRKYIEEQLFNGEYFYQKVMWKNLRAKSPLNVKSMVMKSYSTEAIALSEKEGPPYQYGSGCMSDGCIGAWMTWACGLDNVLNSDKVVSHLKRVYKYNFKKDLSEHANPQRPGYALGNEGGLVLCTWPKGGRPTLPVIYCDEVMTGIEYEVASYMLANGMVKEGLEIVRTCRNRYDGRVRNPFDEYEYGNWYGRAMASYALLQGYTGARYDATEQTLYLKPVVKGDFRSFLCTANGYGTVGIKNGKPFIEIKHGNIAVERTDYAR